MKVIKVETKGMPRSNWTALVASCVTEKGTPFKVVMKPTIGVHTDFKEDSRQYHIMVTTAKSTLMHMLPDLEAVLWLGYVTDHAFRSGLLSILTSVIDSNEAEIEQIADICTPLIRDYGKPYDETLPEACKPLYHEGIAANYSRSLLFSLGGEPIYFSAHAFPYAQGRMKYVLLWGYKVICEVNDRIVCIRGSDTAAYILMKNLHLVPEGAKRAHWVKKLEVM